MTSSPDVTPLIDLTLLDVTAQDLVEQGLADALTKLPGWQPREGNTEVVLLETQALMGAETVYAVNRLPRALLAALLAEYGLTQDPGTAPTVKVTFTTSSGANLTVPAGTRLRVLYDAGASSLDFTTDTDLLIPGGTFTGTVTATGATATAVLNGTPPGAAELVDSISAVDAVATSTEVIGGVNPEDLDAYLTRGGILFRRLVSTLVLPEHFTAAALEDPAVVRAHTYDLFNPDAVLASPSGVTATGSTTGGSLAAGTYSYRVSARNADGETLASTAVTATIATTTTGSVALSWTAPTVPAGTDPVTGYRVYGRIGGSEGLLAEVTTTSYTDTGAATVGAAPPTANTTGGVPGDHPGHVTVAVAGAGGTALATQVRTDLEASLEAKAHAALIIHTTNATVTDVNVTVSVVLEPGATPATVTAAVEAALKNYLNPDAWPFSGTVYRNELIALIDRVPGVARVATLTAPAADVTLAGVAPLARAGTVTVTTV